MNKYEKLCKKSFCNNLFFDGIGDIGLTLYFIPFLISFLVIFGYLSFNVFINYSVFLSICSIAGDIALVFFLLTFIMTLKSDKSSRKLGLYYVVLGLIYYAATSTIYLLAMYFETDGDFFYSLAKSLFPDNYILSIAAFIFLYYFLFYEPTFKKPTIAKHCLFRSCQLIPLLYILLSYVFSALSEANILSIPYLVEALFSGQSFIQELMGLILIYAFYFLRQKEIKAGKKPKEISEYPQSFQNILISAIVVGLSILDWILCTLISPILDNAVVILQIQNMKWAFTVLPVFVFYNNDDSEEKHPKAFKAFDWYYTGAYLILAAIYAILLLNAPLSNSSSSVANLLRHFYL